MRKILSSFLGVLFLGQFVACASVDPNIPIRRDAEKLTKIYLKDRLGEENYPQMVRSVYSSDHIQSGGVLVFVNLVPLSLPMNPIRFRVFADLEKESCWEMPGKEIPDCSENPELCEVKISSEEARIIAKNQGLEQGLKEWQVELRTIQGHEGFVWAVGNTTKDPPGEVGSVVIIDAYSGRYLTTWDTIVKY